MERLVETFCAVDDFCKTFLPQGEAYLLRNGTAPRGPAPGLCVSEIMTILLMLHGSGFKYLKSFYHGVTGEVRRRYFPEMPCYERFVALQPSVLPPLLNARNMAETIIGHLKAFSSLKLPKHHAPINAFLHLLAALTAYQLDPIKPDVSFFPLLSLPA